MKEQFILKKYAHNVQGRANACDMAIDHHVRCDAHWRGNFLYNTNDFVKKIFFKSTTTCGWLLNKSQNSQEIYGLLDLVRCNI